MLQQETAGLLKNVKHIIGYVLNAFVSFVWNISHLVFWKQLK